MSANPVAQFNIVSYGSFELFGTEIHFTNQAVWLMIGVGFISTLIILAARQKSLVPSRLQSSVEMTYEFIQNMMKDITGTAGLKYMPYIFTLFLFITVLNVFGMIPGAYAATSQIILTAVLALAVFISTIVIGFMRHGIKFLSLFYPPGLPVFMAVFLIPLEIISFFVRPLTLAVRLGANMIAGHIALKIFAMFVVTLSSYSVLPMEWFLVMLAAILLVPAVRKILAAGIAKTGRKGLVITVITIAVIALWPATVPLAGLFALTALELFVAFLQAYIFTLLACVYLNDALHLH